MAYRIKTSDESILAEEVAIKAFEILLRSRTPRISESTEDIYIWKNFRQTSSEIFEKAGERLGVERLCSIASCSSALLNARKVRLNACCLFRRFHTHCPIQ